MKIKQEKYQYSQSIGRKLNTGNFELLFTKHIKTI